MPSQRLKVKGLLSRSSSFGRARPCQGRGGRFEPGLPLQKIPNLPFGIFFWFKFYEPGCPGGGTGRHAGLKILFAEKASTGSIPVPGTSLNRKPLIALAFKGFLIFRRLPAELAKRNLSFPRPVLSSYSLLKFYYCQVIALHLSYICQDITLQYGTENIAIPTIK